MAIFHSLQVNEFANFYFSNKIRKYSVMIQEILKLKIKCELFVWLINTTWYYSQAQYDKVEKLYKRVLSLPLIGKV